MRLEQAKEVAVQGSNVGIIVLVVLAVPVFFQVVKLAVDQKRRHVEIVERLERLERSARR